MGQRVSQQVGKVVQGVAHELLEVVVVEPAHRFFCPTMTVSLVDSQGLVVVAVLEVHKSGVVVLLYALSACRREASRWRRIDSRVAAARRRRGRRGRGVSASSRATPHFEKMRPMEVLELRERVEAFPRWHYQFDLGNGITTPIWKRDRINRHEQRRRYFFDALLRVTGGSLRGRRVLDLGCNAGFWSLNAIEG